MGYCSSYAWILVTLCGKGKPWRFCVVWIFNVTIVCSLIKKGKKFGRRGHKFAYLLCCADCSWVSAPPVHLSRSAVKIGDCSQRLLFNQNHRDCRREAPPGPLFKQKIAGGVYNIRILYICVCVCTNLLVISAYTPAARKLSAVKAIRWAV